MCLYCGHAFYLLEQKCLSAVSKRTEHLVSLVTAVALGGASLSPFVCSGSGLPTLKFSGMLNEPDDTSQPMGSALSLLQTPMAALLIRPCNALALEALHTNMPMQLSHDCKFVCNAWTPKPITKEATPGNDSYEAQHLRQRVISNQAVIIMQQKRYYSKMIFQLPFQCKSVVRFVHLSS